MKGKGFASGSTHHAGSAAAGGVCAAQEGNSQHGHPEQICVAYASLPDKVRARVNRDYLLPPDVWHQMFGRGVEIQNDSFAMREAGNIMLLQLTYDDLMQWSFGDNGIYRFWIAPDDLISRNWSAARMSFECH